MPETSAKRATPRAGKRDYVTLMTPFEAARCSCFVIPGINYECSFRRQYAENVTGSTERDVEARIEVHHRKRTKVVHAVVLCLSPVLLRIAGIRCVTERQGEPG